MHHSPKYKTQNYKLIEENFGKTEAQKIICLKLQGSRETGQ